MTKINISSSDEVNDFLSDIQSMSVDQYEIVKSIRGIFFATNQKINEDIKYGGLVFHLSNKLIGGIYIYRKHISVEFSQGAGFVDADSRLEGVGKRRRHLKILRLEDITQKKATYFIHQAAKK